MTTAAIRRLTVRAAERAPWSSAVRRDAVFLATGVPLALPALFLLIFPQAAWVLIPAFVACLDLLTQAQRSRIGSCRGLVVPSRVADDAAWVTRLRAGLTVRQLGYHLLAAPAFAVSGLLALIGWGAGLVAATVYGWSALLAVDLDLDAGLGWRFEPLVTFVGLVLLLGIPWLLGTLARLEERAAGALLGPNRADLLERRVEDLTESRAGVVDAADAERRRIERDLHDGAQQRLVSLAMHLGLARKTLADASPAAMQVIVEAHEEAQAAIAELRDLVRGLHPAVLEDRGLDAALSGIAARAPVPVRLDVDLPSRVAPTVEAIAYFTVSEALANVAKHARASKVDLSLRQQGSRLWIVIKDDGIGGADPARGSGLIGLRKRAASVDGSLAINSPLGGPTTITVELPCAL